MGAYGWTYYQDLCCTLVSIMLGIFLGILFVELELKKHVVKHKKIIKGGLVIVLVPLTLPISK